MLARLMIMLPHYTCRQQVRGAALIEVMLAVLVFSSAMGGLLSVQGLIMRSSAEAIQRSIAGLLAEDLLSRIKGNPGQVERYVGAGYGDLAPSTLPPSSDCDRDTCVPAELAAHDLWQWQSMLTGRMAGGDESSTVGLALPWACITHQDGLVVLSILWRGTGPAEPQASPGCQAPATGQYDDPSQSPGNNHWLRSLSVSAVVAASG